MSRENPFEEMIARYGTTAEGPVLFVREILGAVPEVYQEDLLRAVGFGERKISVRSGHGTGKSTAPRCARPCSSKTCWLPWAKRVKPPAPAARSSLCRCAWRGDYVVRQSLSSWW